VANRNVWAAWAARLHNPAVRSDALLQSIATRSPNEASFTQLTKEALSVNFYDDEFDGRIAGRYVFRTQAVFPNGLRGPLGNASAPVHLHDVMPPRTPAITGITLGDRSAVVRWTASPDADLDHYEVYRAERETAPSPTDLRRMTRIGGDIAAGTTTVNDSGLVPAREYLYVVIAVDSTNNKSQPSQPRTAKAIGLSGPPAPNVTAARAAAGIDVAWTNAEDGSRAMVERRISPLTEFARVTAWLDAGIASYHDPVQTVLAVEYRVKLMDPAGNQGASSSIADVPAV
jgi:hypothetical protein